MSEESSMGLFHQESYADVTVSALLLGKFNMNTGFMGGIQDT